MCKFFKTNSCKHGLKGNGCKFKHPKFCPKFMKNGTRQPSGCNLGKNCQDFHPKMCLNSLRKGECFNEHCKFNHIKGTKRKSPEQTVQSHDLNQPPHPNKNTSNDHFLQAIKLMESDMNYKISMLAAQIQQLTQLTHSSLTNQGKLQAFRRETATQQNPELILSQPKLTTQPTFWTNPQPMQNTATHF